MRNALTHLNYVAVLGTAVAGFLLGWLWYMVLFGKAWMAEMKITEEQKKANCAKNGMAGSLIKGFVFTLLATFGLATLIAALGAPNWKHGMAIGLFVGSFISAARMLNGSVWEERSLKLQAINVGHEIALFALQGAILGAWH